MKSIRVSYPYEPLPRVPSICFARLLSLVKYVEIVVCLTFISFNGVVSNSNLVAEMFTFLADLRS